MKMIKEKCDNCKKFDAVIKLEYMQKFLCKNCFSRFFEKRVRKSIRKNNLLDKKDKVAVALSGGKDSMTLLKILHKLSKRAPESKIIAISIDEGTRYRKEGLKISEKFCNELKVEHYIYSFKEKFGITLPELMKKVSESIENPAPSCTYCGVLRRYLLNEKALQLKATKLATGHNLDDEVQSAMMNFIRGDFDRMSRLGALVGVIKNKKFVPKIKPFRSLPENEILTYAKINKIPFHSIKCPYSKDAFRKTIKEVIEKIEKKNPGVKFQILSSLDNLIPILREHLKYKSKEIRRCKICDAITSGEICKVCEILKKLSL